MKQFNGIWSENKAVGLYSAGQSYSLWLAKQKAQYLQESMDLLAETELYANIGASAGGARILPQKLHVIARKGDWYQVQAAEGLGWIHPSPGKLAVIEQISANASWSNRIPAYQYPDAYSPKVTFIDPQTMAISGRYGTWQRASAPGGDWWIDGRKVTITWPEKAENSIPATDSGLPEEEQPEAAEGTL